MDVRSYTDRTGNERIRGTIKVEGISKKVQERRLKWWCRDRSTMWEGGKWKYKGGGREECLRENGWTE